MEMFCGSKALRNQSKGGNLVVYVEVCVFGRDEEMNGQFRVEYTE